MLGNNDILRRVRYALDLRDPETLAAFEQGGKKLSPETLAAYLGREGEPGYKECGDAAMDAFLSGLIVQRRGRREDASATTVAFRPPLTNNQILKKLRVALQFRDDDIRECLALGGLELSKSELTAIFRKEGQKNYKPCGDQLLRDFLKGLSLMPRGRAGRSG